MPLNRLAAIVCCSQLPVARPLARAAVIVEKYPG
jgi:hypothetical protein